MESIYHRQFKIEDIHLDCFGRVKPSVLLYFAQEVAGHHAGLLGTGWEALAEKQLFWAILRNNIQVDRLPTAGETITLETWPMPTTRAAYPRATVAYDSRGQVLFRSTAIWVLMNTQTRTMILPGKSGVEVQGILRGTELPAPGSIAPAALPNRCSRTVGYTLLDRNGHMNNTRYLDWVDDLLPADFHREHPVRGFTVCYLAEAREGQTLALDWAMDESLCLHVEAHREKPGMPTAQERVFAVQVHF
jgi:acyl-ACP thioesterase